MARFWTVSEASLPEGPFTSVGRAREAALNLSKAFQEPVEVLKGPSITNWSRVEEVQFTV